MRTVKSKKIKQPANPGNTANPANPGNTANPAIPRRCYAPRRHSDVKKINAMKLKIDDIR